MALKAQDEHESVVVVDLTVFTVLIEIHTSDPEHDGILQIRLASSKVQGHFGTNSDTCLYSKLYHTLY